MKQKLLFTKGDTSDLIDNLIDFLEEAKSKGATHYEMEWSRDPQWDFKWFRTYRIKSEKEVVDEKIDKLKKEIETLESKKNESPNSKP